MCRLMWRRLGAGEGAEKKRQMGGGFRGLAYGQTCSLCRMDTVSTLGTVLW